MRRKPYGNSGQTAAGLKEKSGVFPARPADGFLSPKKYRRSFSYLPQVSPIKANALINSR
jgi:hypothetical protein